MTEVIKTEKAEPAILTGSFAEALDDVSRSAQRLLADVSSQPRALRIRAGDVLVELEWPAEQGTVDGDGKGHGNGPRSTGRHAGDEDPAARHPAGADALFDLCSPTVGTFYCAPEPGAAPFVNEGDNVRKGQQVAIVEAMKLMIPIEAERDGQVVAVHPANGGPVEYGARLFTFAAAGPE